MGPKYWGGGGFSPKPYGFCRLCIYQFCFMGCYDNFTEVSNTKTRHFWCIRFLGSLQEAILLLCVISMIVLSISLGFLMKSD